MHQRRPSPIASGSLLAVLAALSFGVTTPFVERAGRGIGPLTTAALLYGGACGSGLVLSRVGRAHGAALRRAELARLTVIALAGAGVAPVLLAWGLQRAGATTGSLLLNLEAVFTILLARVVYGEPLGWRVGLAMSFMVLGGVTLTSGAASSGGWSALGALAITGATAAWALDNTLSRALAAFDPLRVVVGKGALGALMTGTAALALHEPRPSARSALVLLLSGATGYGFSLRLYLLAQRRIGAARTGSIFALAPFVGAAVAWLMGGASLGGWALFSVALFGAGVWLHVTERHRHAHVHPPLEHEHPHRHDDGHHDHRHEPPVTGEHSHVHRHERLEHEHEHAPDLHHEHAHSADLEKAR